MGLHNPTIEPEERVRYVSGVLDRRDADAEDRRDAFLEAHDDDGTSDE
jgi:hypothetical protein